MDADMSWLVIQLLHIMRPLLVQPFNIISPLVHPNRPKRYDVTTIINHIMQGKYTGNFTTNRLIGTPDHLIPPLMIIKHSKLDLWRHLSNLRLLIHHNNQLSVRSNLNYIKFFIHTFL